MNGMDAATVILVGTATVILALLIRDAEKAIKRVVRGVEVVTIRPGDVIVLRSDREINAADRERASAMWREAMSDGQLRAAAFDCHWSLQVLRRESKAQSDSADNDGLHEPVRLTLEPVEGTDPNAGEPRPLNDAGKELKVAAGVGRDVPAAPPVTNSLEEPHGRIITQPGSAA